MMLSPIDEGLNAMAAVPVRIDRRAQTEGSKLTKSFVAAVLGALKIADEAGLVTVLESMLDGKRVQRIERGGDADTLRRIAGYRQSLAAALESERVHGAGSKYDPLHPFNVKYERIEVRRKERPLDASFKPPAD